ncbi:predicted protein [Nematostella vectensis]|uniref:Thioredoxin domain-containing protein n=1 Tax=Nematostella vectensis TaxID=45351 RepID=A7RH97_NEMVE|nr:predicted protein [Nematostella vectensis]|eukprot:XP_001641249.1 predicted protein [Nematostella vectensis]
MACRAPRDTSTNKRCILFLTYLLKEYDLAKIPEFDPDIEWLNCKNSLSFREQLRGKLCVLDFFTYCCINCMHILPDLEEMERKFSEKDGLVIVGVHSAKFENERSSANILSAVIRYDIRHAVVNDSDAKMWHTLGVSCWPTLVIVGPGGELLLSLVGEGHKQTLLRFVDAALKYYKCSGQISDHEIGLSLAKESIPKSKLLYPGKVCLDGAGRRLVIADTGHHRVIVCSTEGVVHEVIGGEDGFSAGFQDGTFKEAKFHAPQGVAMLGEVIYVADTENHAIREINLDSKKVTTVAGTGRQGADKEGGRQGREQTISSPWGVALGPAPGSKTDDNPANVLYIAMAGTHQIWSLYLDDGPWLKGGSHKAGTLVRFAGSGNEENRNNSYPHKAAFAQPSGLAVAISNTLRCLFVADSESSSVRCVDIETGATKAVVGADRDPMNLFAFGDVDGKGVDAKFQHPLGVAWNPQEDHLLVADSYNHKIKTVEPKQKTCSTFLGHGKPDPDVLDEPGGLCISQDSKRMYIADTNNHVIRVVDLQTKTTAVLNLIDHVSSGRSQTDSGGRPQAAIRRLTSIRTPVTQHPPVHVTHSQDLELRIEIALPPGCHFTEGATSRWQAYCVDQTASRLEDSLSGLTPRNGVFTEESLTASTSFCYRPDLDSATSVQVEAVVYFCEEGGTCRMEGFIYDVPLIVSSSIPPSTAVNIKHSCHL